MSQAKVCLYPFVRMKACVCVCLCVCALEERYCILQRVHISLVTTPRPGLQNSHFNSIILMWHKGLCMPYLPKLLSESRQQKENHYTFPVKSASDRPTTKSHLFHQEYPTLHIRHYTLKTRTAIPNHPVKYCQSSISKLWIMFGKCYWAELNKIKWKICERFNIWIHKNIIPKSHIPSIKLTILINHLIMLKGRIVLISKPSGQ